MSQMPIIPANPGSIGGRCRIEAPFVKGMALEQTADGEVERLVKGVIPETRDGIV